jgi:soluble lytic murein transglycosylase-like protein
MTTAAAVLLVLPSTALATTVAEPTGDADLAATDDDAADATIEPGELEEAEDELSQAARSYEEVVATLERAERELELADERMHAASAQLARVERELVAAERAREEAEAAKEEAAELLAAAETRLTRAQEREAAAVELLELRTIEVYKYGVGLPQRAMVQGLVSATDWHELAVISTAVGRVVENDNTIVRDAVATRADADDARLAADERRRDALAAEQRAVEEHEDVETLLASQRSAVAQIRAQQQRRAAILAELEADAEVSALLVSKLEDQVAGLRSLPDPRLVAAPAPSPVADPPPSAVDPAPPSDPDPSPPPTATPTPSPTASPSPTPSPSPSPTQTPTPTPTAAPTPPPGAAPAWASRLPTAGRPWAASIDTAARNNGLDGRLLAALVWTESSFRPDVVSHAGAIGLAQLMPATAAWLGVDPWDPPQNLHGGARYLMMQYDRFGSVELALAAYNAGPTRVANAGPGIPNITETQLYVIKVLERYAYLAG